VIQAGARRGTITFVPRYVVQLIKSDFGRQDAPDGRSAHALIIPNFLYRLVLITMYAAFYRRPLFVRTRQPGLQGHIFTAHDAEPTRRRMTCDTRIDQFIGR
jgi:hypothetical protein